MKTALKNTKGFTLIELLVVIAIIATLAVVVFVALNPAKRFADSRNSRRWTDVSSISTAIHSYIVDNNGTIPAGLDTTLKQLGTCASGGATLCAGAVAACLDMGTLMAPYLKSMPLDPSTGSAATTGYSVIADANNIITVAACGPEQGATVELSR